jgi:hypothetical protein
MYLPKKCFKSRILLNTILKDDASFDSLKNKFPEILGDLTSARINPSCSCVNKVKLYLISKIKKEKEYFNFFFKNNNLRLKLIKIIKSENDKLRKIN